MHKHTLSPKQYGTIAIGIVLLLLFFGIRPALNRAEATKTTKTILDNWKTRNFTYNHIFWVTADDIPPFYNLTDYKITKKSFKTKNDEKIALVTVRIDFAENDIYPTGKEWLFEYVDTSEGWRVKNFGIIE